MGDSERNAGCLWLSVLLGLLALLAACAPPLILTPTPPPPTATATALIPTWTPTPEPTPTATATPTPVPPPDPAPLSEAAKRGLARVQAAAGDGDLLCLRYEDTTGDGRPEWVALVHQPQANPPRLSAFVLHEETFYPLTSALVEPGDPDYGLGQYATCRMEIRDVNADGRPEIAIFGNSEPNRSLLHLYVWEGGEYRLLGAFRGTAEIFFENVYGELADAVVEGYRDSAAPSLVWQAIFTWDGQTYGWTSDRWAWHSLQRPQSYPTHRPEYAVVSFYLALHDRDLPGAYGLMTGGAQAARPYGEWARGFDTMLRVEAGNVSRISGGGEANDARVSAILHSWDNEGGRVVARVWEVEWWLVRTEGGWRLSDGSQVLLDSWDVPYWP